MPDLQSVMSINETAVFRDHLVPNRFYYLKSAKRLIARDNKPDFSYSVNRYMGNVRTGDQDAFWVRGVIKFSVQNEFADTNYQQLKNELIQRYGKVVELDAVPVSTSYNKLVFSTITEDDQQKFSGELDAGDSDVKRIFGSRTQRFTIGVSGNDANLFWENFSRENLSLSLAYGWTIPGKVKSTELTSEDEQWIDSTYQVNNTLPITVSPQQYPELFSKNELWQRTQFAHSGIKLMCYDFINLDESDLYYVNVEFRFKTKRDQFYSKSKKFKAGDEAYEADIDFALANDLKDGYEYRVRRLRLDGEMTQTDWQTSNSPWLDVSMTSAELEAYSPSDEDEEPITENQL